MITIKHLIIFKEVARVKSMSKAAENLYISQPSISQKIQEIESYYNVKLFQRYSKSLGISQEGQLFLEHANRVLNEIEELDKTFFNNKENITLRIGTTLTVGTTIAPKLFKDIKEKYNNLNLSVYVDNTQSIESLILENQLDIGIIEGDIHNENIIQEDFIDDKIALICSSSHPFSKYKTITPDKLANMPFIVREKGSATRSKLEKYMIFYKVPYHITWQCHSWESVKEAVLHNHGLTLISINLIEKELEEGLLHIVNVEGCNWDTTFSICYHKNKAWNQNLEIFKNYILNIKNYTSKEQNQDKLKLYT
ncbi:LysR family transcriptional regulator [[Clostridium] colinum]|uniref:LysR family transcriptional regulator n=1 Tax=[Clostridium] colinum TaxID=36835 RepID=UPI00202564E2|nr:LysR family transcriptional regulator [[Clostridium] colinum]